MKPHFQLLLALVLGATIGTLAHNFYQPEWLNFFNTHILQSVAQIFLRLIFMVVVPMLFSALVLGVFDLGGTHGLAKVVSKTLFYTLIASATSVLIGIGLVQFFKPGAGFQIDQTVLSTQSVNLDAIQKNAQAAKPLSQTLIDLIPKNPIDSAARALDGEMLALMIFALFFGIALSISFDRKGPKANIIIPLLEQIFATCMKIVDVVMKLAPIAVFALVFNTAYKFGHNIFGSILNYVLIVVVGILIQQFVVYSFLLKFFAKKSPIDFFKKCREVYLYAFSTASSNATLPRALETAEKTLKLPPQIAKFVLTIGSTANQNGTALFEGVTVLFLAQVYGIDLSFAQQIQVVVMSILAGVGTAGVPGGSLPLIMILLQSVGIPPEGLGLILGVDRFLDMCRTTLNVSGDLVITALVSSHESKT